VNLGHDTAVMVIQDGTARTRRRDGGIDGRHGHVETCGQPRGVLTLAVEALLPAIALRALARTGSTLAVAPANGPGRHAPLTVSPADG
jgi:hypothetical protein